MITLSPREIVSLLLFLLVFFGIYGLELLLLARYALNRIGRRAGRNVLRTKGALGLHVFAVVGLLCLLYGYFIEPYWVAVNMMTIRTPKLTSAGFRLVQISDLHCDDVPRNEEKAVRIINSLKPDIIVATGDYLNRASALPRLRQMLNQLEAPRGKFAVLGNIDAHRWSALAVLEGTGFRLLRRETVVVTKDDERIGITGLDFARSEFPLPAVGPLPDGRFDVLLFHTPDLVEQVSGRGVDLYLCGHTHGGQVRLPLYGALVTFSKFGKKYESGLHRVGATTLYVNRGLGLEPRPGPQVRFLARPEIAVFDIVPERP
jgi:predicted MPP superfamily phosphohydrolase